MDIIQRQMDADLDLPTIARRIRDEEIGRRSFLRNEILDGVNVVTFASHVLVPDGMPFLLEAGSFPQDPAILLWTGAMLVKGEEVQVHVFRPVVPHVAQALAPKAYALESLDVAIDPPSPDAIVHRALSAPGCDTVYASGGAIPPLSASAWPHAGAATDCSGFVAWCLRMSRRVNHPLYRAVNGGWFETTAVYQDGLASTGFFSRVPRAEPGCLLVYPDRSDDGGLHQGHIGIVVKASGDGIAGVDQVVHCSLSAYRKTGDAIRVSDPGPWLARKDSIIVRFGE